MDDLLETWYRRFGPLVLRRCRRLLRDEDKAVDAMHDVFVTLLRRGGPLHDAAPAALLLRVATQVCLNRLRGERRHPEDADDERVLAIARAPDSVEGRSRARRLLAALFGGEPESTRVLAVLHLVDGLSLEETAAAVGLSVSGVRRRLRLLRERAGVGGAP